MHLLFPSVRLFFTVCRCQGEHVFLAAVTVRVCTDSRQEGRAVYCFRPCGVPAVMDGLGRGFSSGLWVSHFSQVQLVRSPAATANHAAISLEQKELSTTEGFLTTAA